MKTIPDDASALAKLWRELADAGLISGLPTRLGGGNEDRHPSRARSAWRACLPDGTAAKLTVGADLGAEAERAREFGHICDGLSPAVRFHHRGDGVDVLAMDFVDGESFDHLLQTSPARAAEAIPNLKRLVAKLRSTSRASDPIQREAEWQAWTRRLQDLAVWNDAARTCLRETVLPLLRTALFAEAPMQTWVHGDLIGRNILVGEGGRLRLIDPETAESTHFPESEFARFHILTAGAHRIATQLLPEMPSPSPAGELQFWLQQIEREVTFNDDKYVTRWLPHRLGEVRRAAELLAGAPLANCPWAATTRDRGAADRSSVDHAIETARWLIDDPQHAVLIAGWCCPLANHEELTEVVAEIAGREVGRATLRLRPDVQAHFGGRANTLRSGFELRLPPITPDSQIDVVGRLANGRQHRFWTAAAGRLPGRGPVLCHYQSWAELLDPDPAPNAATKAPLTFSVLVPVHNPPIAFLRACLDSVRAQSFAGWELCLVDDASTEANIRTVLQEYAAIDPRIRVNYQAANGGIAQATNVALRAATGDFVVFLDHDDVLRPFALTELAQRLGAEPDLDVIYSDEDKIDADGRRVVPMFKPNFSPEYLRGVMYIGHVLCVRRTIALDVGGLDSLYDGVQDYEFMLRVSERTRRIGHIPRVLYHWRQSAASSALVGNVKGDMDARQLAAVRAHLQRIGDLRSAVASGGHRVRIAPQPEAQGAIGHRTAIIPWTDGQAPLQELAHAAAESSAEILILANVKTAELRPHAIAELAALAGLADSGCVAPVLISADGFVVESGIVAVGSELVPVMAGFDAAGDGYNGSLCCTREVDAVSAWCVAVRRELAAAEALRATSWADFLRRVRGAGLFHRVCAGVRLQATDGGRRTVDAAQSGKDRAPSAESGGPAATVAEFYNPHFALAPADYRLALRPSQLERSRTPFVFHLETTVDDARRDGWLELRGWCFHLERAPVQLRLRCAGLDWAIAVAGTRPDVAAAHPLFTDGRCGFAQRVGVPAGTHELVLEACQGEERHVVLRQTLRVSGRRGWHRWRSSPAARLVAFQLSASPAHAPRPLEVERFPATHGQKPNVKFSIVTPSFQQARFLRQTIASVLEQDADCEYVVQDGGSTDGTSAILQEQAGRLSAWASEPDGGQSAAIAKGFQRSSGRPEDLMAWINSDDFYLPGALGYVARYFAAHPDVDVIYGHRVLVDDAGKEIGRWFLPSHDPEVLRLNDFVPQETMFWRRRMWNRVGGIDPGLKFAMDWDLLLRFQDAGAKMVRVPYFLACFRIHPAQKTSAQMSSIGQQEIDALRRRTFGRVLSPSEIESHPRLIAYLRKSGLIEFLWRSLGIRTR